MLMKSALPAGARLAGAVALAVLAATQAWSQTSEPAQGSGTQATGQQVVAPTDPIIAEVRQRLAEPARRGDDRSDRAALTAFYAARTGEPVWVTSSGLNARAQDAIAVALDSVSRRRSLSRLYRAGCWKSASRIGGLGSGPDHTCVPVRALPPSVCALGTAVRPPADRRTIAAGGAGR